MSQSVQTLTCALQAEKEADVQYELEPVGEDEGDEEVSEEEKEKEDEEEEDDGGVRAMDETEEDSEKSAKAGASAKSVKKVCQCSSPGHDVFSTPAII